LHTHPPPPSTPFPYTTLFRSRREMLQSLGQFRIGHRNTVTASDHIWAQLCQFLEGPSRRLPIACEGRAGAGQDLFAGDESAPTRSEEHTSELQSLRHLVCRLL